jgi:hypothetical protein
MRSDSEINDEIYRMQDENKVTRVMFAKKVRRIIEIENDVRIMALKWVLKEREKISDYG